MTDTEEPLQVKVKGGVYTDGGDSMNYVISLPKDHPDGQAPQTITGNRSDFRDFQKALDIMAAESQVLILVGTYFISGNDIDLMASKLPEGSWIQHHAAQDKHDNTGVCAWVKAHLPGMKKSQAMKEEMGSIGSSKEKKKYLIADWYSSAGFEFPAVIFVTNDYINDHRNATFCQRAKAKLVIYQPQDYRT